MSRDQIIQEMLEPCGGFLSKLEWLAHWLDVLDHELEVILEEPIGDEVQRDLRRWALELRDSNGS